MINLLNLIYLIYKEVDIFKSNKKIALQYLKEKEHSGLSYATISELTGYSISHLKKLKVRIENEDIESLKVHGLIDKKSNNTPMITKSISS